MSAAAAAAEAVRPAGAAQLSDANEEAVDEEGYLNYGGTQATQAEGEWLGQFKSQIVGIRYYQGTVGRNEMVKFVREPLNLYDANAIRVENIRSEKVGHLRRELAAQIAALLDSGQLAIEGMMTGSGKRSTAGGPPQT